MFILKFCSQIRIAINKEKNILNRENLMFMLKFCSQILIAINNKKINKHRKISILNFHILNLKKNS
jgi:hypothetical protein